MKNSSKVMVGVCVLTAGFVGLTSAANAAEHGTPSGQCTMSDVAADKVLYDGDCIIKQTIKDDGQNIWEIQMGINPFAPKL